MKINLIKYNTLILCFYINSFFLVVILKTLNIPIPIALLHIFLLIPTILKMKFNKLFINVIFFFILIILATIYNIEILKIPLTITYVRIFILTLISIFYINLEISLNLLSKYLKKFLIINLIFLIYVSQNKFLYEKLGLDYMSWGYLLLPIILFYTYYYQKNLKFNYLLLIIGSLFLLLIFGSRFNFLIGFIGVIFLLYQVKHKILRYGIVLGIIVSFLILFNLKNFLLAIIGILNKINLPTDSIGRLIYSLNNFIAGKDISSGRNIIYIQTLETIKKNIFFGNGIFGYIGNIEYRNRNGTFYPHNIFLEILLQFGIIGLIVFLILILLIIKKIYVKRKKGYKLDNIYFIFIILSLKLLLSDSYLMEIWFWFVLLTPFNKSYYKKIKIKE